MRSFAPIFIWLAVCAVGLAQKKEESMNMIERMDAGRNRAMAALNSANTGKKGKKAKSDPLLESRFNNKTFQSGGDSLGKKANGVSPFLYDQKFTAQKFDAGRSFFGIKNPWFGNKVYRSGEADLWSKTLIANSDKKFRTGEAETKKAFDAEKMAATVEEPAQTKAFIAQAAAPGYVSQISDKITKDMTIEEVRELLNKNR